MDLQAKVCEGHSGDLLRFPIPSVGADHDSNHLYRAGQAMELENAGGYRGHRADYGVQRRLCGYAGYGTRRYTVSQCGQRLALWTGRRHQSAARAGLFGTDDSLHFLPQENPAVRRSRCAGGLQHGHRLDGAVSGQHGDVRNFHWPPADLLFAVCQWHFAAVGAEECVWAADEEHGNCMLFGILLCSDALYMETDLIIKAVFVSCFGKSGALGFGI